MEWEFEDGTVVRLGGEVEGDSPFAHDLRLMLEISRNRPVCSWFGASPDYEELDASVPHLLDSWLRTQAIDLVSAPEVEYPVLEPCPAPPEGAAN